MKLFRGRGGEQTKNFLSTFWRLPPAPPSAFGKVRKFLGLLRVRSRARLEARYSITTRPNVYAEVQSHHALRALRSFLFKIGSREGKDLIT